jgi:aspartyl-tRNA(Asn)/glutamyl-tRNA(Gln) amidotransferase subunit C
VLTKEQVKHVANLAKLKIDDAEAENYSAELSKVLGYIDQLNEIDTGDRQVDIDLSGAINRWREDRPESWDEEEKQLALHQAEVVGNNLVKVPKIM